MIDSRVAHDGAQAISAAAQTGQGFCGANGANSIGPVGPKNRFAVLLCAVFGKKAEIALRQYASVPDRTGRRYKRNRRAPAEVLIDLLLGAEGYLVLSKIMDVPKPPTWWLVLQHERQLAGLLRQVYALLPADLVKG